MAFLLRLKFNFFRDEAHVELLRIRLPGVQPEWTWMNMEFGRIVVWWREMEDFNMNMKSGQG